MSISVHNYGNEFSDDYAQNIIINRQQNIQCVCRPWKCEHASSNNAQHQSTTIQLKEKKKWKFQLFIFRFSLNIILLFKIFIRHTSHVRLIGTLCSVVWATKGMIGFSSNVYVTFCIEMSLWKRNLSSEQSFMVATNLFGIATHVQLPLELSSSSSSLSLNMNERNPFH